MPMLQSLQADGLWRGESCDCVVLKRGRVVRQYVKALRKLGFMFDMLSADNDNHATLTVRDCSLRKIQSFHSDDIDIEACPDNGNIDIVSDGQRTGAPRTIILQSCTRISRHTLLAPTTPGIASARDL